MVGHRLLLSLNSLSSHAVGQERVRVRAECPDRIMMGFQRKCLDLEGSREK